MTRIKINDIDIEGELSREELKDVFGGYFTRPLLTTRRDALTSQRYTFDEPLTWFPVHGTYCDCPECKAKWG